MLILPVAALIDRSAAVPETEIVLTHAIDRLGVKRVGRRPELHRSIEKGASVHEYRVPCVLEKASVKGAPSLRHRLLEPRGLVDRDQLPFSPLQLLKYPRSRKHRVGANHKVRLPRYGISVLSRRDPPNGREDPEPPRKFPNLGHPLGR